MLRFLKSAITGLGGSVGAALLFLIAEFVIVWVKVHREKATGMGAVVGGVVSWPLYVAAAAGFMLAFTWMWRRS